MRPRPHQARYLNDLSPAMSTALVRCHLHVVPARRNDHGQPATTLGIRATTIRALITHQLVDERRDKRLRQVWKPTDNGLRVITAEPPRFLAQKSQHGYTTNPHQALLNEPEAVDDHTQRWYTADAHDRHQGLPGRREQALQNEAVNLARRLKHEIRSANTDNMLVVAQLERIRREILALEQLRNAA